MNHSKVTVLGAGMVGICCGIELQRQGYQVTIIDRGEPGGETSSGNAGLFSLSSITPLASPGLIARLPALMLNRSPEFRLHYPHAAKLMPWMLRFLLRCNRKDYLRDGTLINALTVPSVVAHRDLIKRSFAEHLVNDVGILKLYRRRSSYDSAALERELYELCDVDCEPLERAQIRELEPDLNDCFEKALWVKRTVSITNPQALCQKYANYFVARGGSITRAEVKSLEPQGMHWRLYTADKATDTDIVVVCLGSWTPELLRPLGYRNATAIERGYHTMFSPQEGKSLSRPVFDSDGAYVMIPMSMGLRVTTGTNLTYTETEPTPQQVDMVLPKVREAFPVDRQLLDRPWMGRRCSTPDTLPMIGPAPKHKNLWMAFGHSHMGFTMGPISGQIIASQINGSAPPVETAPYLPERYL